MCIYSIKKIPILECYHFTKSFCCIDLFFFKDLMKFPCFAKYAGRHLVRNYNAKSSFDSPSDGMSIAPLVITSTNLLRKLATVSSY